MHLALASSTSDPAFTPEPLTEQDRATLAGALRAHAADVLDGLRPRIAGLPPELVDDAWRAVNARARLYSRFDALATTPIEGVKIRIHGDYHLGQVLLSEHDVVIIDFEGEPARTLAQRRTKYPALKDVAGMVRSYSYAGSVGLFAHLERQPRSASRARGWVRLWEFWTGAAFLRGYRDVAGGTAVLPDSVDHVNVLLEAFLLDKACYELGYELNHRPSWVRIPLAGLLALV